MADNTRPNITERNARLVKDELDSHVASRRHLSEIKAATGLSSEQVVRAALDYLRDTELLHENTNNLSLVGDRYGVMLTDETAPSQKYHHARTRTAITQLRRDFLTNVMPLAARYPQVVPTAYRLATDIDRLVQDIAFYDQAVKDTP